MKALISIAILIGLFYVGKAVWLEWTKIEKKQGQTESATPPGQGQAPAASALPGLPPSMEPSLAAAQGQGASALKVWLDRNRQFVGDPRLADIELDYVVLMSRQDLSEARQVFKNVKDRTPPDSPVMPRIKRLEKNF